MKGAQPCWSPVCASQRFLNKCALRKSNLVLFFFSSKSPNKRKGESASCSWISDIEPGGLNK